jgi:hypothetical protein
MLSKACRGARLPAGPTGEDPGEGEIPFRVAGGSQVVQYEDQAFGQHPVTNPLSIQAGEQGMATGANDSPGPTASASWFRLPVLPVNIRRITITVNPCSHGHRAWVAL